nr:hypothetical protein [Tanacetum cinerariifolium]
MKKYGYGYLEEIMVRRADNKLYKLKEGDFPRLQINDIEDILFHVVRYQLIILSGDDVVDFAIALRMLLSSLEDITKNIDMKYLPKRRWSTLEKKRAYCMIKYIYKLLKEWRMMRSLEKFVGGRFYKTDLKLLQRTISLRHIVFTSRSQNRRDLPRDISLDSVVVLRYEKRSTSENKGKVPTEMGLVLEQTQQGFSYEVSGKGSTVLVESHHTPTGGLSTSQPYFSPTLRIPIRQETEVPQPSSHPHTNVADEAASTGVDVRHEGLPLLSLA